MSWVEEFDTTIPNDTATALAVQERIIDTLEKLDYSTRDVFGVRLALEEALVNAIKHGNRNDPRKSVRILCQISAEKIIVAGSLPSVSQASITRSRCAEKTSTWVNGRLNSDAKRAARRGVRFGPPPPMMIGGWGLCTGFGSAGESVNV